MFNYSGTSSLVGNTYSLSTKQMYSNVPIYHFYSKNALMIDHWEIDGDLVTLEEELGEGAFGKVYKGILKELSTPSRKLSIMPPKNAIRKNTLKKAEGFTVAVKMLHGELHVYL